MAGSPAHRLASITDPLQRTTRFAYDGADRVTSQTFPDGRAVSFTYDTAGNLTSVTPPSRSPHTFTSEFEVEIVFGPSACSLLLQGLRALRPRNGSVLERPARRRSIGCRHLLQLSNRRDERLCVRFTFTVPL